MPREKTIKLFLGKENIYDFEFWLYTNFHKLINVWNHFDRLFTVFFEIYKTPFLNFPILEFFPMFNCFFYLRNYDFESICFYFYFDLIKLIDA